MMPDFFNINFEITHKCNLKCQYCYNSSLLNNSILAKPLNTIKRFYRKAFTKQLTITGGEPLLSEYLIECVLHARLRNSKVLIITNASVINNNLYKELISIGADFQITINSDDSIIHDSLSGVSGTLCRVKRNLELILSNDGNIIPTIVLTRKNIHTIKSTIEYFKECGLKTIIINRYNLINNPLNMEISLNPIELRSAFALINQVSKEQELNITSNVCTPYCILNPKDYENISFGQCPDNPKLKPLTIDFEGNFRLCNHSHHIIGNIYKDSFVDMLYSDYALNWISNIPDYCNNCKLYDKCKGGCKAAAERIEGTINDVDPILSLFCN